MALYRCECKPSKELLPRRHLYLFRWTPFSITTFTDTYNRMPGGSYKTYIAYLLWCLWVWVCMILQWLVQKCLPTCIQLRCLLAVAQWESTACADLNRWIPSMSRPAGPLNSVMMDSVAEAVSCNNHSHLFYTGILLKMWNYFNNWKYFQNEI